MEGEGVDLVLSRAVELRLKISNCIHKATITNPNGDSVPFKVDQHGKEEGKFLTEVNPNSPSHDEASHNEAEEEEAAEDAERLLHIRDALESLEHQLSNLQALQEQQRYEREVALSEIEHSRKILLNNLKEYKGSDLEVIQEASTFVGETVEHNTDLLLPPYPSRAPPSLVLHNHFLSHPAVQKSTRNWVAASRSNTEPANNPSRRKGVASFVFSAAKALISVVGVISVLSLAGKRRIPLKITDLEKNCVECPPGRVLVTENGESRCVVKERVAIPFEAAVAKPGVDFGCG